MTHAWYDVFSTSWGWVGAVASEAGLRHISLPEPSPDRALEHLAGPLRREAPTERKGAFADLQRELEAYLAGDTDVPSPVLDLSGATPFFLDVWEACRSIPRGETRTYSWLASEAGRPSAMRAAGQAMARNRVPLIIPCHRVLGRDGGLHGFAGPGVGMKARLLEIEGAERQPALR